MQKEQIVAIDAQQKDSLQKILIQSPILTSNEVDWNAIGFFYHQQPAHEIPECSFAQHLISIYLGDFKARRMVNGNWQNDRYASGDLGIFPAHQTAPKSQCDRQTSFISLFLEPKFFARVAWESVDVDSIEIVPQFKFRDPLIRQIGLELKQELELGGIDSRFYAESMATALSVHLISRYTVHPYQLRNYTDGLPKYKLRQVIAYINEQLDKNISLAELADLVQMSPHYFASLFKQSTGLTPHQYLTRCRFDRAKQLLAQSNLTIVEVCQQVGYQSQSHFTKVFRQQVGITPKVYRNSL